MRILINGCSHLDGTGLGSDIESTKQITWPALVWQQHDVHNIAEAGSSNDSICRRTIQQAESNCYDFVCVQWAIFERIEVQVPLHAKYGLQKAHSCLHSNNALFQIDINGNGEFMHELAKYIFLKQFDTEWFIDYNLSQIIVLQNWLQTAGIPYLFVMTDWPQIRDWSSGRAISIDRSRFITSSWFDFCHAQGFNKVDAAHYEHEAHVQFAQLVHETLERRSMT